MGSAPLAGELSDRVVYSPPSDAARHRYPEEACHHQLRPAAIDLPVVWAVSSPRFERTVTWTVTRLRRVHETAVAMLARKLGHDLAPLPDVAMRKNVKAREKVS